MSESQDRYESSDVDPADTSEHAQRNRTQLEFLKLALERKRHRDYIDAMLEETGRMARGGHRADERGGRKRRRV